VDGRFSRFAKLDMTIQLVTVGLPFFNPGGRLRDAIRSVFAQSIADWELILVDDGSTDSSTEIARRVDDRRVTLLCDGRNVSQPVRRNQIARLARARYLAWLDADDMMHPDRLLRQTSYMEANPLVDVVGTGVFVMDDQGRVVGKRFPRMSPGISCDTSRPIFIHPTVMAKAEWFRQNPYDETLVRAQDLELWLRTAAEARFHNLAEPLVYYAEFDSFSPRKYRISCRFTRAIIRRHGPRTVGKLATYKEIAKASLKPAVYTAAYLMGFHRFLLRRRTIPMTAEEKRRAESALRAIRGLKLPGEDPV
jgi:glycosyltransferase involved in cell wall biosynthesis